ncbi:eIF2 kinase Gcn2p negative regulator [Agyrium rufum]|nr:eIF2 kinase Gcn2p negative regulator [Agyrium rufum]
MSEDLLNEISALNSIYTTETLIPSSSSATASSSTTSSISSESQEYILTLPSHSISLSVFFPSTYPATSPPNIQAIHSVGSEVPKGAGHHALNLARSIVAEIWREGEVCLFDLVEELESKLKLEEDDGGDGIGAVVLVEGEGEERGDISMTSSKAGTRPQTREHGKASGHDTPSDGRTPSSTTNPPPPPPTWSSTTPLTIQKSIFQAHTTRLTSPSHVEPYITALLSANKSLQKATHNISAYRIRATTSTSTFHTMEKENQGRKEIIYQDSSSDGETAAGGRLLHLLQVTDAWDVLVVVSRWYGGVKLGPERFRIIGRVAREGLVAGGFVK